MIITTFYTDKSIQVAIVCKCWSLLNDAAVTTKSGRGDQNIRFSSYQCQDLHTNIEATRLFSLLTEIL
jgi:hypothetical protein